MSVVNGSNTTQAIYGTDLVLLVEITAGNWQPIAHATSHTMDISRDTREISSKSTGEWKNNAYAKIGWSGSCDALVSFDTTVFNYPAIMNMIIARTKIKVVSVLNDITKILATPAPPDTVATPLDDERATYPVSGLKFKTGSPAYQGLAVITAVSLSAPEGDNATFNMSFSGASPLEKVIIA